MKLSFILLILVFSNTGYTQDSQESYDWNESIVEDSAPIDRPVVDYEDSSAEPETSEVNSYDYDY